MEITSTYHYICLAILNNLQYMMLRKFLGYKYFCPPVYIDSLLLNHVSGNHNSCEFIYFQILHKRTLDIRLFIKTDS